MCDVSAVWIGLQTGKYLSRYDKRVSNLSMVHRAETQVLCQKSFSLYRTWQRSIKTYVAVEVRDEGANT